MHSQKRFAGARIGAEDITDITSELKSTLEALNKNRSRYRGFDKRVDVPGTGENVSITARSIPFEAPEFKDGAKVLGNPRELERINKANSPGMLELAWSSSNRDEDPATKLRVGRTANLF